MHVSVDGLGNHGTCAGSGSGHAQANLTQILPKPTRVCSSKLPQTP